MIEKGNIVVAETLLNMVLNDHRASEMNGYIGMFENCREQGYRIMFYGDDFVTKTIAFSENRNSDDIVVYNSEKHEEHAFGYSDEFWESARYFRYDDYVGAKKYIIEIMEGVFQNG